MKYILLMLIVVFFSSCNSKSDLLTLKSPSGNLKVVVTTNNNKQVFYRINSIDNDGEKVVLFNSPLGVVRNDVDFTRNLQYKGSSEPQLISDNYLMSSGKQSRLDYNARETDVVFSTSTGEELEITFRVFDEGVAFRYRFPGSGDEKFTVTAEATGFAVSDSVDGWMSPYQVATSWGNPGYEEDFLTVKSGTPSPDGAGWCFPLLFHSNGKWIYISEAGLDENYCGTHLNQESTGGIYTVAMPAANERLGDGNASPASVLPWEMPWRFILISDSLNGIVESQMVYHLAESSKIKDTSWIKPGRASWEWWSSKSGRTVKELKHFVDLAAEMGWEYSLVDAGWEQMPDGNIEDVVDYANNKNVGLLLWYNSGGRRDSSAQNEEFVLFNDDTREKEMSRLEEWGIKGIKVDFFATDKQFGIALYRKILEDAARHRLLVDFHGCTLPRGWTRTYPNLLTMEAVRGAECYRFSKTYPDIAASYNTMAALLRGTAGPTDFTPATFSDNRYPHKTTSAHELALTVVYESGIVHMADTPESYRSLKPQAIEFLKKVPAAWDESKLIKAVPGELFIVARRKGEKWFVAGINGKNEVQDVTLFLPEELTNATCISDGEFRDDLVFLNTGNNSNLSVSLKPNGGFVIF